MEYASEIKSIDNTLKWYAKQSKILKSKKVLAQSRLYEYMKKRSLDEIDGINIKKITPKPPSKRRSVKQRKEQALATLREVGVRDPEDVWQKIK